MNLIKSTQFTHHPSHHILVLELDHSGAAPYIKELSLSAAAFLGYSEQELIGKPVDLIYAAGSDKPLWEAALANVVDKSINQSFAYRDAGKEHEPRTVSLAYRDVGEGRELGAVSFSAEVVTQANNKIRALISLTA
ncbi:MAG: PAS domain-containing protein [Methylobacter sp.]|uniref:PAS domain-containing protein n=1 Tax=Methylobacter sp. TaxID=2051955 RepID=UPI0025D10D1F|nr:PAS domain-containing protein [Methylobacter sp.]MCK9619913.1 PAS domain-containing protein [Methylobacter sp.]